jgi:hypothetical protein
MIGQGADGTLLFIAILLWWSLGAVRALGDAANVELARRTHWAYQPIEKPPVPTAQNPPPAASPIDHFIVAALEREGMTLSAPADKRALLRRATFDLTGLPPAWDEVQSFIQDESSDAFAKVVDRLLASPRYGERWGRHWLDIARYADTHGGGPLGAKKFPFSYTYRDYVIRAFNQDLPYDQFLLEQIAADQLELNGDPRPLAALGFLTVGRQFRNPHDLIDDRIDVVTRGLMGLTVTCARCHDHKYDAIPTEDYYSLYAVFAASEEPAELPLLAEPDESPEYRQYERELNRRKTVREDFIRDQSEVMRGRLRMQVGLYLRELAKGTPEQDLSTIFVSYRTEDLRPLVLERWRKYLAEASVDDPVFGVWHRLSQLSPGDFAQQSAENINNLRKENGEDGSNADKYHQIGATAPKWNPRVLDAISNGNVRSMLDVADAYGTLFANVHRDWLQALAVTSQEAAAEAPDVSDEGPEHAVVNSPVNQQLRRHLYGPDTPTAVPDELARKLLNRPIHDRGNGLAGAVANLNLESPGSPPRAMVLKEGDNPPVQSVFIYGDPIDRGSEVPPRFLSVLAGPDAKPYSDGQRRLQLAHSIVDPANPLTSRVAVNWVWHHHFGQGLVRTPNDFGVRGQPPTHPDLLDFLAATFVEEGWSIKKLHRRIMLSAAYQQSAGSNAEYRLRDSENQLLWRMPHRRLELEEMRDAMLAAAMRLETTMGGRPFNLFRHPCVPRRTVYGFINRDVVPALFSTFDMADPNACTASRPETTVPQQALFALNSDFIQEQAKHLSELEDVKAAANDADRIVALYRHAYARQPNDVELAAALQYVQSQPKDVREKVWQRLAHVLLAANEFVFLD